MRKFFSKSKAPLSFPDVLWVRRYLHERGRRSEVAPPPLAAPFRLRGTAFRLLLSDGCSQGRSTRVRGPHHRGRRFEPQATSSSTHPPPPGASDGKRSCSPGSDLCSWAWADAERALTREALQGEPSPSPSRCRVLRSGLQSQESGRSRNIQRAWLTDPLEPSFLLTMWGGGEGQRRGGTQSSRGSL